MLIRILERLSLVNTRQNTQHLCLQWKKNLSSRLFNSSLSSDWIPLLNSMFYRTTIMKLSSLMVLFTGLKLKDVDAD